MALSAGGVLLGACAAPVDGSASPSESSIAATPARSTASPSATSEPLVIGELVATPVTALEGVDAGAAAGRSLNVPDGWSAEVWANLPGARLAAWTPDGRLLVSTGGGGEVWVLTPGSDGGAPSAARLLSGLEGPQGLAFAEDGSTLVVGEASRLVAYEYSDGALGAGRVILDGLPAQGHGGKAVAVQGDTVYYSLGSRSNRDPSERSGAPERAVVGAVSLDGTGNRVFAHGVRNGFALDFAPDGSLFVAVNQMDNLPYPYVDDTGRLGEVFQEFVNDHPVEQLTRLTDGIDLGWPLCVPDSRGGVTDLPFVNDAELNLDGAALDCSTLPATQVGLPAHSAPLGLTFTHDTAIVDVLGAGALVGAHGSWNRTPPQEPYVAFAVWDDTTRTLGAAQHLVTGFQNPDGSRWGRAVMPTVGPDGAIYVTDDYAGLVYRVAPPA